MHELAIFYVAWMLVGFGVVGLALAIYQRFASGC